MSISIDIVPKGFKEAQRALKGVRDGYPKAASRAINKGLLAGRTMAAKLIRARYNLKSSVIKEHGLQIKKASTGHVGGELKIKGRMLPLMLFSPKVTVKRTDRRGPRRQFVRAAIIRGSTKAIGGAFVAKGKVMTRKQPERMPIWPVLTISVAHMLGSLGISKQVEKRISEVTNRELWHNVERMLMASGAKKG
jgi:Prophage minor tail protein Z (GPZ)